MVRPKQLEQYIQQHLVGYDHGSALCLRPNSLSLETVPTTDFSLKSLARTTKSKAVAKKESDLKHKFAERDRRRRICQQYNNLRAVLPNLIKMGKASVLGETIRQIREQRKRVKEMEAFCQVNLEAVLPGDSDNLSLGYCEMDGSLVKATFCCEDRPELMSDLTREVRKVDGIVVRSETVFVGGRIKSVLWVKGFSGKERMRKLKNALKMAMDIPNNKKKHGKSLLLCDNGSNL